MELVLNGRTLDISDADIYSLLRSQELDPEQKGVAVALNGEVIPRANWGSVELREGDVVEIITAMQGG